MTGRHAVQLPQTLVPSLLFTQLQMATAAANRDGIHVPAATPRTRQSGDAGRHVLAPTASVGFPSLDFFVVVRAGGRSCGVYGVCCKGCPSALRGGTYGVCHVRVRGSEVAGWGCKYVA